MDGDGICLSEVDLVDFDFQVHCQSIAGYEFRLREPLQLKFVVTFNLEQISGILHGVECCLWMLEHVYNWKKFVMTFFLPIG